MLILQTMKKKQMKKVFADVIGSSKKRKRMDHTKTKEKVIERKKKI